MSHSKNKIDWCLRKAEKEIKEGAVHRGLRKTKPNKELALEHIRKAEHFLRATSYLKEGDFSDISASTVFYAMYHSLLAIAAKFGYESHNQECTFALMASLIEEKKIKLSHDTLDKIAALGVKDDAETSVKIREKYQYGTSLNIEDNLYNNLVKLAHKVISETKVIIEE